MSPFLACWRGLWDYEVKFQELPTIRTKDVQDFAKLAFTHHMTLSLPPETLNSEVIRKFLQGVGTELPPVAAMLGGMLAQDVINVIGKREQPIQNFVVFDGENFNVPMHTLHPESFDGERKTTDSKNGTNGTTGVPVASNPQVEAQVIE